MAALFRCSTALHLCHNRCVSWPHLTLFSAERQNMRFTDTEIYAAMRHLIQQGYAALTLRERLVIDSLCAIC